MRTCISFIPGSIRAAAAALVGIVLFTASSQSEEHDYYVGVAECRYFPEANMWIWEQKLFTDDLEAAYNHAHPASKIRLDNARPAVDSAVAGWLLTQFSVTVQKKTIPWTLISRNSTPESTVLRWKSRSPDPQGKTIAVRHDALRNHLPQQIHLVHFRRNDYRNSYSFKETGERWILQIP